VKHFTFLIGAYCSDAAITQCFTDFAYMYDTDTDVNTGFMASRPTSDVLLLFSKTLLQKENYQLGLNFVLRTDMKAKYAKNFKGLDRLLYANAESYFDKRLNDKLQVQALAVHVNFVTSISKKKELMQRRNLWYI
jgi:hypothetical protein